MKILQWVSFFTFAIAATLIIYSGFNLMYPYQTIEIKSPAHVLNPIVHHGETLQVEIDYTKYADGSCRVIRQVVDGFLYSLPVYKSSFPKGKGTQIDSSAEIPNGLPEGTYYMIVTLEYDFPPFRTVSYEFETEKFTVIK